MTDLKELFPLKKVKFAHLVKKEKLQSNLADRTDVALLSEKGRNRFLSLHCL